MDVVTTVAGYVLCSVGYMFCSKFHCFDLMFVVQKWLETTPRGS